MIDGALEEDTTDVADELDPEVTTGRAVANDGADEDVAVGGPKVCGDAIVVEEDCGAAEAEPA